MGEMSIAWLVMLGVGGVAHAYFTHSDSNPLRVEDDVRCPELRAQIAHRHARNNAELRCQSQTFWRLYTILMAANLFIAIVGDFPEGAW